MMQARSYSSISIFGRKCKTTTAVLHSGWLVLFVCLLVASSLQADTIASANRLILEGKYDAARTLLDEASRAATGDESAKIDKMQEGLRSYRATQNKSEGSPLIIDLPTKPMIEPVPKDTRPNPIPEPPVERSPYPGRIITLGGYAGCWSVASSYQSPYEVQGLLISTSWPAADIKRFKDAGYIISSIAGDENEWAVVMSRYKDRQQRMQYTYGPAPVDERMQSWIADAWNKGYRITSVAGFAQRWVVVITSGTGWGRQRFTEPGSYKKEWVQRRMDEGYHITSAAGDAQMGAGAALVDTYLIVATQGTGWGAQTGSARMTREVFRPWLKSKRDSMIPATFLGFKDTPGAFFSAGPPFATGWGYLLSASTARLLEWSKAQRIEESTP